MFLRIFDGFLKNRSVFCIKYVDLRPTKNFVRKILLDWVRPFIINSKIIDLFSGSGILSFELISNGALKVYLFDINNFYINILFRNINNLNIGNYLYVFNINSFFWIKKINNLNTNIILFDPPYRNIKLLSLVIECFNNIDFNNVKVLVYFESYDIKILKKIPYDWILLYSKKTGNVNYFLLRIIK